jgi:hypothetical protein
MRIIILNLDQRFLGIIERENTFSDSVVYFSVDGTLRGKFNIKNTYREGVVEMLVC